MAALTTYAKDKVLDKLLKDTGSFPATWYYALFTSAQDEAESATECADANYARMEVAWNAASSGVSTNDGLLLWDAFAANQSIVAIGICDNATAGAGNVWLFENLGSPTTVLAGQQARVQDEGQLITVT